MKKKLSALLALVMVVTLLVPAFAFAEEAKPVFSDLTADDKNQAEILDLASISVLNGYPDGTFKPEGKITRAEFTKVLSHAMQMENAAKSLSGVKPSFKDYIDPWAWGYINLSAANKFVVGMPNGTFSPNGNITYGQVIAILVRSLGYNNISENRTPWFAGYLETAVNLQIVDRPYDGNQTATRSEVAHLVWRYMVAVEFDGVLGKINFEDTANNTDKRASASEDSLVDVKAGKNGIPNTLVYNNNGDPEFTDYTGDITGFAAGERVRTFGMSYPFFKASRVTLLNQKAGDVVIGQLVKGINYDRIQNTADDNTVVLNVNGEEKEFNVYYLIKKNNADYNKILSTANQDATVALLKGSKGWEGAYQYATTFDGAGIVEKISETNLFGNTVQKLTIDGKEYVVKRKASDFTPTFKRIADPEVADDVYGDLTKGADVKFTDIKVGDYVQFNLDSKKNFVEKIYALGITHKGYIESFYPGSASTVNDYGTGAYMTVRIDLDGNGNFETTRTFDSKVLDKVAVTKNGTEAALKNLSAGLNVTLTWDYKTFRLAKVDATTATASADSVWFNDLSGTTLTYTDANGKQASVQVDQYTSWKVTDFVTGEVYVGNGTTVPGNVVLKAGYKLNIELKQVTNNNVTTVTATNVVATPNTVKGFVNSYQYTAGNLGYVTLADGTSYVVQNGPADLDAAKAADSTKVAVLLLNKANQATDIALKENTVSGVVAGNDSTTYTVAVNGTTYTLTKADPGVVGTTIDATYMENANGEVKTSSDFVGIKNNAYITLTINRSGKVTKAESVLKVYQGTIQALNSVGLQTIDLDNQPAYALSNDAVVYDQNGNKLSFENLVVGETATIYVNGKGKIYMVGVYR